MKVGDANVTWGRYCKGIKFCLLEKFPNYNTANLRSQQIEIL